MSATSGILAIKNGLLQDDLDAGHNKILNLDTSNLDILPSMSGQSGKFLSNNGSAATWLIGGTVTSVALSAPSILSVAGSPVTGSGTLALTLATQATNTVLAGNPAGGTAAPAFRVLVAADIPSLNFSKVTAGVVPVAQGGTNLASYAVGDLIYASGATTISKLAGVATGNALISGGVATAPAWGKVTSAHTDATLLTAANNLSDVGTKATAQANLMPTQAAQAGKYLTTDGTSISWASVAGSGSFTSFIFTDANGFHGTVANASSAPALTLKLGDTSDPTKAAHFVCSNITAGQDRAVNVPDANSTTVQPLALVTHKYIQSISAQGLPAAAIPVAADLSDLAATIAPAFVTLTDAATVTLTADATKANQNAKVTLAGNRTLAFSGVVAGMSGILQVVQDGTGGRTLALPATSIVVGSGAGAITLSAGAGAIDFLSWVCYAAASYAWTPLKTFT